MSPSIWTECGGRSNVRLLALGAWRLVESQFVSATRKLVDSDEEQGLLETLIDRVKPPVPAERSVRGLHYLLYTPFRYPPLLTGSRFGRRIERGIFYAAREEATSLAEVAYYRFVFLSGTAAELRLLETQHTAFQVRLSTAQGVDLTAPPFVAYTGFISSKTEYAASQALGAAMRADSVHAALYVSARARRGGTNAAVFDPATFASPRPTATHEWLCTTDPDKVEFKRKNLLEPEGQVFPKTDFLVDGRLPAPALA